MSQVKVVAVEVTDPAVLAKLSTILGVNLEEAARTGQVVTAAATPAAVSAVSEALAAEEIEEEPVDDNGECPCASCQGEEEETEEEENENFGTMIREEYHDDSTIFVFDLNNVDTDSILVQNTDEGLVVVAEGFAGELLDETFPWDEEDDRESIYVEFDQANKELTVIVDRLPEKAQVEEDVTINFV